MNELEKQRLIILGMISQLPEDQRTTVENTAAAIRGAVKAAGDMGPVALSLVGVEYAIGHDAGAT